MILNIHTLGPKETDSYNALKKYLGKRKITNNKVILHKNFDEIIENFNCLKNEYIFMPVAYKSKYNNYGWTEINFKYSNILKLIDIFKLKTMPMYLLENKDYIINKCSIHPSTLIFMKMYLENKENDIEIEYSDSKFLAFTKFKSYKYRYCITSEPLYQREFLKSVKVIKKFYPDMIWCLYKVMGV